MIYLEKAKEFQTARPHDFTSNEIGAIRDFAIHLDSLDLPHTVQQTEQPASGCEHEWNEPTSVPCGLVTGGSHQHCMLCHVVRKTPTPDAPKDTPASPKIEELEFSEEEDNAKHGALTPLGEEIYTVKCKINELCRAINRLNQ